MSEADPPSQPYRHPGQVFLSSCGAIQSEDDINRYVSFLRQEAKLSDQPPIDLDCIYKHFGIPTPRRVPLDEQQGILVDSSNGIILIKEDDPLVRQRFTEGHELIELLFDAHEQARTSRSLFDCHDERKERLCDQGAADLLMPQSSFIPKLNELGISLNTGRILAQLYQTSLIATLVRMIQQGSGEYALVMWHCAYKPKEMNRFGTSATKPQKKLRVWWRTQTRDWAGGFIPKNKSIPYGSLISYAYVTGQSHTGRETIHLGWGAICCHVEAMPMQIGDKYCVLSLIHLLNSFR